jgi:hypothetical protein
MAYLEFRGLGVGESKRHPEVETLLVARDTDSEVMRKVSDRLTAAVN